MMDIIEKQFVINSILGVAKGIVGGIVIGAVIESDIPTIGKAFVVVCVVALFVLVF